MQERLQKILSRAGIASRREAEQLILEGRVSLNGKIVKTLGVKADPFNDHIKVDEKRLKHAPEIYLILNKPKGYLSTMKDPKGRKTVRHLLKNIPIRLFPIGRLDYNSEGLLLFTNDGNTAHCLMHPSGGVRKKYLVKIKGFLSSTEIAKLEKGIMLDGVKTLPMQVKILKSNGNSWIEIAMREGRKNQIRRMLALVQHPVLKLKRISYGFLTTRGLAAGQYRILKEREIKRLKKLVSN
jgi:pseudouridine synthase